MKKSWYLLISLIVLFISSCSLDEANEENEFYQYSLGVLEVNSASDFTILTDWGYRLKPVDFESDNYEIKDSARVLVSFTFADGEQSDKYDYNVKLGSIATVETQDILIADEQLRDTIANDGIIIKNLSIGNNFINVEFSFWANSEVHEFDLVYDSTKQDKEDYITLSFHHDDNDDVKNNQYTGLISFPLDNLNIEDEQDFKIFFTSKNEDNSTFEYELVYKNEDVE